MRMIDADALKANVPDTSADIFENCRNCKTLMDWQVKELIDQQPTASTWHRVEEPPTQEGKYLVGFCKECDHHMPPLLGKVNGEVKELTPIRCPRMASGFTQPNGWCYQFRKDGADLFLDTCGRVEMPIEPPKENANGN